MKDLYISIINFCITHLSLSVRVRDILIWPLASRILGRNYSEPHIVSAGFTLNAFMEDQLGRFATFYGPTTKYFWEPVTMQLLERLVKDANEVVIAGSHIGLTALYARTAMKRLGSRVHTFEPIAHLYDVSQKNFQLNAGLGEIVLSRMALGDTDGEVTMTQDRIRSRIVDTSKTASTISTEVVPITTISHYCTEKSIESLDLILLDVEGYEYNALKGMEEILSKKPPRDIIYEISLPKKDNLAVAHRLDAYMKTFGYICYIIEDPHDPIELRSRSKTAPIIVQTSPLVYEDHLNRRYFNVYATLRTSAEVADLSGSIA